MSSLTSLSKPSRVEENQDVLLEGDSWGDDFPGLYQFLCWRMFEGKPRLSGKLGLAIKDGKAQIRFTDPSSGKVAFYVADSLAEALEGADKAFQQDTLDWRKDKYAPQNGRKRA